MDYNAHVFLLDFTVVVCNIKETCFLFFIQKKVRKKPPPSRYFSGSIDGKQTHDDKPKTEKQQKQRQHMKHKDRRSEFKKNKKHTKVFYNF